MENKIDTENKIDVVKVDIEDDTIIWRSGCFELNKGYVKFMASFLVALVLLAFSIYSLVTMYLQFR